MSSTPPENSYGRSENSAYDPMADWDAAFASDDPTRVLPAFPDDTALPQTAQTRTISESSAYQRPASYRQPVADSAEDQTVSLRTSSLGADDPRPITAIQKNPVSPARIANTEYKDSSPTSRPLESEPVEYLSQERPSAAARFARLQLLPCLLGWLVGYALLTFLTPLISPLLALFKMKDYGVPGRLLPALQESPTQATTWLLVLGLAVFISYAFAGYTASRMARYAAFKQAVGVTLWGIFATTLVSLGSYFFQSTTASDISFQHLLGGSLAEGLPGVITYFCLALLAACVGALFGKRFESLHRRMS